MCKRILFLLSVLFMIGDMDLSAQFNPNLTYGSVTDVDGNTYKTIQIGSQVWFAENLRAAKFSNGDSIPHVPDANDWRAIWNNGNPTSKPAWCYFLNNASNNTTRGKLYNWYAIADNRNICPTGWHVPTDLEFTILIGFLDSAYTPEISFPVMTQQSALAGGKLKSTGTQFWQSPNDGATNSSGFSAIWGGHRSSIGSTDMFVNNGTQGVWWTSSDTTIQHGWHRSMGNFGPNINKSWFEKSNGASVRCLKNQELPLLPVVFTLQAKTTSFTSAVSGGKVVSDGGSSVTERGICWSTSPLPTINQSKTSSGTGMGNYGSSIANIQESTIYYVRAYATNSVGTSYGNQVSFKTGSSAPSAHSCGASDVHNSILTYGTVTDQQGNLYKTIQIGNQTWMAENLRTSVYRNGDPIANYTATAYPPEIGETGFYNNDTSFNCPYGRLYNWYAINDNRKICPLGWHIPTDGEWIALETFLGGKLVAGSKMKSTGSIYWSSPNSDATNSSGFSGLPGTWVGKGIWWSTSEATSVTAWGRYLNFGTAEIARLEFDKSSRLSARCVKDANPSQPSLTTNSVNTITNSSAISGGTIFTDGGAAITEKGICWSTSPEPTTANNKLVSGSGTGSFTSNLTGLAISTVYYVRSYAVNSAGTGYGPVISFSTTPHSTSVHTCGAVNVHNPNLTYGSVTDQQGNSYKTIQIGTQTWMAENLKTSIYRNGDPIIHVPGNQWGESYTGAWCHFNNDPARDCPYGKIYNYRAVNDNRNVCPSGWHVPTKDEIFTLMKFLDPGSYSISGVYQIANAGTKMRNTGTQYWDGPNNATNSSGFSALPAGSRSVRGNFFNPGLSVNFWTSDPFNSGSSWNLRITNEDENTSSRINTTKITGNLVVGSSSGSWGDGYSVRCMRDNDQGITPPVLVTNSVSSVAGTTATSGGNITADGGSSVIERGVCWNTAPSPSVVNNKLASGTGVGTFTSNLTGLAEGTTYYLRAYAINSAGVAYGNEVTFTTTTSPLPTNIDFVNLQFPGSITAPQVGFPIAVNVYAQVYTAGLTEAPGAGAGITAWIGYSSSNTNPSTWTNWIPATFNTQSGNNDEYVATIGNNLGRGTYYYASRFQRNGGPFYYGGYNASGGNIWNGTTFVSGVLNIVEAPSTIDYVNLQFPGAATINQGGSSDIYAQVYTKDLTEAPGAGAGISAWIGISTRNLQPSSFTTWIPATFHKQVGNNDEYKAVIGSDLPPGTYYYASKFQRNGGTYYGGYSSSGGNFWNGSTFVNGILTVNSSSPTSPHTCPGVSVHNPTQTYGMMSDQQGNQYKTIKIGNLEWMAENLKTTIYRNGDPIPNTDAGSYNNENSKDCPYGKYYSGFAITDNRNICPAGWHVPFDAEWNTLITTLDPSAFLNCSDCIQSGIAGGSMKSTGVQYWTSPNTGATNSSGMSVIGGGQRFNNGTYGDLNNNAYLWAAPNPGSDVLTIRNLNYDKTSVYREIITDKRNGYSVRCLKDNPQGGPTNTNDRELVIVKEQIYPNPNNGQFDLNIQTGILTVQPVRIKVMDMYGKVMAEFMTQNNRGLIRHRYNGSFLASGVYTVQYTIGQQSRSIKMVVQR